MKNFHEIVNDRDNEFNIFKLKFNSEFEGIIGSFSYSDKLISILETKHFPANDSVNVDLDSL